ncbi:MAG: L-lactate dehydrogenase [Clostridia bacterium]|nr:L-lactate dehydrogenase [Clostridia bacterium]
MFNIQKCAVIGCGFVGATTAFSLMQSGLFSEMVLIDVNRKKAEGEAMDLTHGLPFLSPMQIYAGDYRDLYDASLIVITAGAGQKPGETRTDLVHRNVEIFRTIVNQIVAYTRDAILLVVSNPVDVLTYAALKMSGYPPNRVIGSGTVLDTARLKHLVGEHLGVDSRNVHTFIIGEHGDSELPVWSSANVSGIDLGHFCDICATCGGDPDALQPLFAQVRDSAYHIIEAKGATYYAIALAVTRIAASIVRDENSVLPVSTLVDGHYGLQDVCLGLPAIVGRDGVREVLEIPLNDREFTCLRASADKMKQIIAELGSLALC